MNRTEARGQAGGRPWRGLAAAAVAVVVILAVAASGLYRRSYGAWFPAAPDRVEVCGRRFYQKDTIAPSVAGATAKGLKVESVGRKPPKVGWVFLAQRRDSTACLPGALLRRRADGRFQTYTLSGSP
jgi:hypothetical protein